MIELRNSHAIASVTDHEGLFRVAQQQDASKKSERNADRIHESNLACKTEEQLRSEAELLMRQAEAQRKAKEEAAAEQARLEAEAKAQRAAHEKARKEAERLTIESKLLDVFEFAHSDFTEQLCPEAVGHFCMLWGDHGHGGYCTQANGYIQGGQPMDDTFELISIYIDFKEALSEGSWYQMRNAVRKLRQLRIDMGYSKAEEREGRMELTSIV